MTIAEAQKALHEGKKISHMYFLSGEYIQLTDNKLLNETGLELDKQDYWLHHSTAIFSNGWEEVNYNKG